MARLGDIATYINGYAFKPSDWSDNGLPIIRIQDLTGNSYQANRFNGKYDSKYEVYSGDVLISWSASLGVYVWNGEKALLNQHIFKVVFDKVDVDKSFYIHQLESILEKAKGDAHGATMKHLTKPVFDALPFYLPNKEEQIRIATELDKVCNLITFRKDQLNTLETLVKSRFVELFGTVENNVFGYPVKTIGDVATLKSGTSLPSDVENEGGNIPYVKVGDMNYQGNEYYITTSSRYVSEKTAGKGLFEIGTVIFPKRGGAIGTNKKRLTKLPICADLNVMGVTPNKSMILPSYLMSYFELVDLGSLDNGSSVPQINNKDIAPLQICVPPIYLQNQFTEFVEQTDKLKFDILMMFAKKQILIYNLSCLGVCL